MGLIRCAVLQNNAATDSRNERSHFGIRFPPSYYRVGTKNKKKCIIAKTIFFFNFNLL